MVSLYSHTGKYFIVINPFMLSGLFYLSLLRRFHYPFKGCLGCFSFGPTAGVSN